MKPRKNSTGLKIATIHGVSIKLHLSLLILLAYVIFVASAQFPLVIRAADLDVSEISGGPFLWSVIFAVSLLFSVALHELGHVFFAQSQGVQVRDITLMMLGGVSSMEKMPEENFAEFKLAVIGPLISLGIAGFLYALRAVSIQSNWPNVILYCHWLGQTNLVLAIFNILPAFPLDGGRALRSLLAIRQGRIRATQNAIRVSTVFAWIMGAFGFFELNLLLLFIAFFIYAAARNELYVLVSQEMLKGLIAGDVGRKTPIVGYSDSIANVVQIMRMSKNFVLPVQTPTGVPSIVSFLSFPQIPREKWDVTPITSMIENVPKTLDVQDHLDQAYPYFSLSTSGALPLTEEGKLIGIVRINDVSEILLSKNIELSERPAA